MSWNIPTQLNVVLLPTVRSEMMEAHTSAWMHHQRQLVQSNLWFDVNSLVQTEENVSLNSLTH